MTHHAQSSENYVFTEEHYSSSGQHPLYNTFEPHPQDISQSSFIYPVNELERRRPPVLSWRVR